MDPISNTTVAVVEKDSKAQHKLHGNLVEAIYNAVADVFGSMGRTVEDEEFLEKVTEVANDAAAKLYEFQAE